MRRASAAAALPPERAPGRHRRRHRPAAGGPRHERHHPPDRRRRRRGRRHDLPRLRRQGRRDRRRRRGRPRPGARRGGAGRHRPELPSRPSSCGPSRSCSPGSPRSGSCCRCVGRTAPAKERTRQVDLVRADDALRAAAGASCARNPRWPPASCAASSLADQPPGARSSASRWRPRSIVVHVARRRPAATCGRPPAPPARRSR